MLCSTHLRVQKIAQLLELPNAFDRHLSAGVPACRLHLDAREPEPPLDNVAREVDVLNSRVRQVDLAVKQDAPAHRNPLGVESVPHRVIAEVAVDENEWKS